MAPSRRQKKGPGVGKTKKGKGTKIMILSDANGLPLSATVASASPHESKLVEQCLDERFVPEAPQRLIRDRA
jgi:hypothetical protein